MSDNLELQHKIARLAGRINRHKNQQQQQQQQPTQQAQSPQSQSYRASRYDRISSQSERLTREQDHGYGNTYWAPSRGTPYGSPRGRGAGYRHPTHKNRTLVINNPAAVQLNAQAPAISNDGSNTGSSPGWVVKRDRHMQLINNSVYDQKVQQRTQAMAETRKLKEQQREERQKAKIANHLRTVAAQQASTTPADDANATPHVVVNGIKFIVADGGSKLVRSKGEDYYDQDKDTVLSEQDDSNTGKTTPKRANVGGVTFMRSKHGNLYRSGLVKTMRYRPRSSHLNDSEQADSNNSTRVGAPKSTQLCPTFCSTGTCPKGPACRFTHDANKTAICREFLAGKCTAGEYCDLSHDPTAERVPSCLHFMRGNCTNDECKYPHVRVNPGAPVCRAFAVLGYCSKGLACAERHVHECPDYSNTGTCRNKRCRLPHVDRAGQLRKAAAQRDGSPQHDDNDSSADLSSDEDVEGSDSDDIDSDGLEEIVAHGDEGQQLAKQQDFVKF